MTRRTGGKDQVKGVTPKAEDDPRARRSKRMPKQP